MENKVKAYPAPWNLHGKGYIFLYKFKKDFVAQSGNVPAFLDGAFVGGFGSMMLVDYEESNAGPYGELLFIPGKFRFGGAISWYVGRKKNGEDPAAASKRSEKGTLLASGFIAGGALMGVVSAAMQFGGANYASAEWLATPAAQWLSLAAYICIIAYLILACKKK